MKATAVIAQALQLTNLGYANQPSAESDLNLVLDWLQPLPDSNAEPSARLKAAAKMCLRTPSQRLEMARLYIHAIRAHVNKFEGTLLEVTAQVMHLKDFYEHRFALVEKPGPAWLLFTRSLSALFLRHLDTPDLKLQLEQLIQKCVFDEEEPTATLDALNAVGVGDVIRDLVVSICIRRLSGHIKSTCQGQWHLPVVDTIQQWVRVELYPCFALGCSNAKIPAANELVHIAQNELVLLRISEIYDIVCDYPRSTAALTELHSCLVLDSDDLAAQAQQRARLADSFVALCDARLLHLGSNTTRVIDSYIKTIKAFLIVDPTGVLLDKVVRPIRRYLASRQDLVQLLVESMLSGENSSLAEELHHKKILPETVDDLKDINWTPDPIDALPDFKKGKVSDLIEAFVSIFDLPQVVVDEFTRMLGKRLLDHRETAEVGQYVELLKLRFGGEYFSSLDVMVRDVHESNMAQVSPELEVTALSQVYWPSVCGSLGPNDFFKVPVQLLLESFNNYFGTKKKGRYLKFIPSLGSVDLTLTVGNTRKAYSVTPLQAAVIVLFDDNKTFTAEEVLCAVNVPPYLASLALAFWTKEDVLVKFDATYTCIDS